MSDEHVSKKSIQKLLGTKAADADDDGQTGEKLLLHVRVKESDKQDQETRKKPDEDDDGKSGKPKIRYLCVTIKKSSKAVKIRIHKIKQEKGSENLTLIKTWNLDDVKSLESGKDSFVIINMGKAYQWELDGSAKKIEFLYTLVELSSKYLKKTPHLVNLDEELLRDQMQLVVGTLKTAEDNYKETSDVADAPPRINIKEEDDSIPSNLDVTATPQDEGGNIAIDLDEVLNDFSWRVSGDASDLEMRLVSELQALEAANVYALIESEDQANAVVDQIDNALSHLNYIDDWLGYYTNLLNRMGQDVHQVEVRNKTMQTASANQKSLLGEVEKILAALKLPGYVAESLRNEPLDDPDGIAQCERAAAELMRILSVKIDPLYNETTVVSERMQLFNGYSRQFCNRLCEHLLQVIGSQAESYITDKSRIGKKGTPRVGNHDQLEIKMFNYRKLIRWMKETDTRKHYELEMHYVQEMSRVYRKEMHDFIEYVRHNNMQRKVNNEEQELYTFVQQQVSVSHAASNALSAIGSKTLGNMISMNQTEKPKPDEKKKSKLENFKGLYRRKSTKDGKDPHAHSKADDDDDTSSTHSKQHSRKGSDFEKRNVTASLTSLDLSGEEKMLPDETIGYIFAVFSGQVQREQNFIMDLFTSKPSKTDDEIPLSPHRSIEWQDDLNRSREKLKDLRANNRIQEMCEGLFDDIREELVSVMESGLKYDQTFVVGMMARVEECKKDFEGTAYFYLVSFLDSIMMRLAALLDRCIDDQIKAIEETKVTLKKRSGILPFIRTFPRFVDRLEGFIFEPDGFTRTTVSKAYERLVKVIFDTVDVVARDAYSDQKEKGALDDKEQLNIHILTVENMHHFYSEGRGRKVMGLEQFVKAAKTLYDMSLNSYVKVVIRKPLGKLMEFFEGVDGLLNTLAPEEVSFHLQYSKAALKDVIKRYPGKEVKKGLEQLYKRVDKHFTDEEGLLQVVWRGIQQEFTRQVKRYEEIISLCYGDSGIRVDFSLEDVLGYFSDLAKSH